MSGPILMYAASLVLSGWGIAHLCATRAVVKDFREISVENKRIIAMEWIIEGVALVFIGSVVALTTYIDRTSLLAKAVLLSCVVVLNVLSVISLLTGARNSFIAFKLCPFIFTGSSVLIAVGSILQ